MHDLKQHNVSNHIENQSYSGFRYFGTCVLKRVINSCLVASAVFVCLFTPFNSNDPSHISNSQNNSNFSLDTQKAQASVSYGYGTDAPLTEIDRRYITRALSANEENILNLNARAIKMLWGEPQLVRKEFPTTLWQYRMEHCVLDVFFTSNDRDAEFPGSAVHYEMRHRQKSTLSAQDKKICMSNFVPESSGPKMVSVSAFFKSKL